LLLNFYIYLIVTLIAATHKKVLDHFVIDYKKIRDNNLNSSLEEDLLQLELKTQEILNDMHTFFNQSDWLLTSQGKITLYYHVFRICNQIKQEIPFSRNMLAQFEDELVSARKKSYRRTLGSPESLSEMEQILMRFDSEKQSLNDAGAMSRRYGYLNDFFKLVFNVELPVLSNLES
jgi:hypothetical protein